MTFEPVGARLLPRQRRTRSGLTLLEVLGAFLIFSLVFTALVGTSQTGVYQQGRAARRLEASMIADEVMADVEWQLSQRMRPIVDPEITRDIFEVSYFEMPITEGIETAPAQDQAPDLMSLAGGVDGLSLLAMQVPEVAAYLWRYEVEVQWMEDRGPERIVRTTFGLDWEAPELQSLFEAAGSEGLAATGGATPETSSRGDRSTRSDGSRSAPDRSDRPRAGSGPKPSGPGSGEPSIQEMCAMLGISC